MIGTDVRRIDAGVWKLAEISTTPRERLVAYWTAEDKWTIRLEEREGTMWRNLGTICVLRSDGLAHPGNSGENDR